MLSLSVRFAVRGEGGRCYGCVPFLVGLRGAVMWGRKLLGRDAGTVGREYIM